MATKFVTVSIEIMHDTNLTANQKFILAEIEQLNTLEKGCIASNQHFSDLIGIAKESVSRSIKSLVTMGYIESEITPGTRNHERILSINKMLRPPKQNVKTPLTKHQETKENRTINRTINKTSASLVILTDSEKSAMLVSDYLFRKILTNQPNFKSNTNVWSKDIDRAIRLDKRTENQLRECIDWIYSEAGSFWIPNIQSGKKLREKFNTIEAQMISKKQKATTIVDKLYDNGMSAQDMIKEMEKRA